MEAGQIDEHGGFNYIAVQELTPKLRDMQETADIIKEHNIGIENHVAKEAKDSVPIPKELDTFISEEEQRLREYFDKTAGIPHDSVKFNDVKYIEGDPDDAMHRPATSMVGMVRLRSLPIVMSHVKNYQEAVIIGHELYHDAAPALINRDSVERMGMIYTEGGDGNRALEEGLAIKHQMVAEQHARKMFPKGAEDYDMAEEVVIQNTDYKPENEILTISGWEPNGNIKYIRLSKDSVKLVDYLEQQIPDFSGLVERARIEHKTLDFAKKIEQRFGIGSYRQIVMTPQNEATELLADLKTKSPIEARKF